MSTTSTLREALEDLTGHNGGLVKVQVRQPRLEWLEVPDQEAPGTRHHRLAEEGYSSHGGAHLKDAQE